jgi:HlyD family secretion protein
MNGEISHIFLGTGDAAPSGFPIATIADLSSPWAAFSAPASEAAGLKEGDVIHIRIPAIGGPAHEFRIETIRERRNAKGGDAEPIEEIRARPLKPIPGLQPGMSALFERRSS